MKMGKPKKKIKSNKKENKWLEYLLIITGLIGFIVLLYGRSKIFISDTGYHIKIGEWIMQNKAVPKIDTFSLLSNTSEMTFIAHEWLFGIFIYAIDKIFSLRGIFIVTTLVVFLSYLVSIFKSKAKIPAIVVSGLFILFYFSRGILCRPDVFSSIIIVYLGYIFAHSEINKYKRYIVTCLGTLFIANFHGGYLPILLAQFLWVALCYTVIHKKMQKVLYINLVLCALVGLINPYGINIYKYLFVLSNDISNLSTDYIPFSFSNAIQVAVVLCVFILSIIGFGKEKDKEYHYIDLCIVFMYLVLLFTYARTINIFTYGFVIYMSKYLKWCLNKKKFLYVINGISIALVIILINNISLPNKSTEDYITNDIIGKNILDKISNERYFNTMESGGYLIYLDKKPFIDSRNDVYTNGFKDTTLFSNSVKAMHSESLMYNLTIKYNLDYILVEKYTLSSQIFYASRLWEVSEESELYVLFKAVY